MAVLQMQRISVCGLKKDRKQILEAMQRVGVVEVDSVLQEDSVFTRTDMSSSQAVFDKGAASAQHALKILNEYVPEKTSMLASLQGKEEISVDGYSGLCDECDNVMKHAYHIIALEKEIAENKAEIIKLRTQIESLYPWLALDVPLDFNGTTTTSAFIGSFSEEMTLEQLYQVIAKAQPAIGPYDATILSSTQEQTCVFVLCRKADKNMMEDALRANSFSYPSVSTKDLPSNAVASMTESIDALNKKVQEAEDEIASFEPIRNDLKFMVDYYTMRTDKYAIIGRLLQSHRTFILTGYIPQCYEKRLEASLNRFDVAIEYSDVKPNEEVPVALKNSAFTEPTEGVLESFGLPLRKEIDPTPLVSITYYILFGLMFSDAGYGVLMTLVCGLLLLKFKNMAVSMRKNLRMFFFCGISTTFWGVMFGSYFGDAINVIAKTYFGSTFTMPVLWFEPIKEPMRMLLFCMLIGLMHLFLGLFAGLFQAIKNKNYKSAIFDITSWMVLVLGLVFMLVPTSLFMGLAGSTEPILPAIFVKIGGIMAIVGALTVLLMEGRSSKSIFIRLAKGLYALYGVTGYLSDILSYSRLLALGLATSVIGSVFNQMGAMLGTASLWGIPVGIIFFLLIFAAGHGLNIGLSVLGAYVHTNRLTFVEFFGKFYNGGSKKFEPFKINSQYINVKEEIK